MRAVLQAAISAVHDFETVLDPSSALAAKDVDTLVAEICTMVAQFAL